MNLNDDKFLNAVQSAVAGDMSAAQEYIDGVKADYIAREALKTKVVVWTTASGKVARSQPKTPEDAEDFASSLIASGKSNVEVLGK